MWTPGIDRRKEKKALPVENKVNEMQKCTKKFGEAAVWPETREKYIKYIMHFTVMRRSFKVRE